MSKYYTKKQLAVRLIILFIIILAIAVSVWFKRQREELNATTGAFIEKEDSVFQYTGKPIKPSIKVFSCNDHLHPIDKSNYSVSFHNNVKVGTATIVVHGKGVKYGGTITDHFKIISQKPDNLDKALYTFAYADNGVSTEKKNSKTAEMVIWLGKKRTSQEIKVRAQNFRKSLSDKYASQFYNRWNLFIPNVDTSTQYTLKYDSHGVTKSERYASVRAFNGPYFQKNWKTLKKFLPDMLVSSQSDLEKADKKTFQAAV